MKLLLSCFYFITWYVTSPASAAIPASKEISQYVNVNRYNLKYLFDLNKSKFYSTEEIELQIKNGDKIKDELVLDSEGLQILSVSLKDPTSSDPLPVEVNNVNEQNITLKFPRALQTRLTYVISILFQGNLINSNTGITKYESNKKTFISTNFLPFYARQAFPCINDISMKSIFSLTITIEGMKNLIAVSNMPQEKNNPIGTFFKFKDTPTMPLHNLFFTVGPYEVGRIKNIYLPRSNDITFNTDIYNVLNDKQYQSFLNISKLEHTKVVCVPGMYPATYTGYGIVALREDIMYVDLLKITTEQKKLDLLNMFGAFYKLFYGSVLVPGNWSDFWLAESIPIYLKYNGLSEISAWGNPNDYIPYDVQQNVLQISAHPDSPAVVADSLKTEEDVIHFLKGPSMLKGASILTMLENALTKEVLADVLNDYLGAAGSGRIVSTNDFVKFLSEHPQVIKKINHILNLKDIINPWLYQSGYPYIQTKRAGSGIAIIEKVFVGGIQGGQQEKIWNFPIHYETSNSKTNDNNFFWLLMNTNKSISLNFTVPQNQWFILNANGAGPYRVNYEDTDWKNIAYAFSENHTKFTPSTRAQLISDSFALLYAGQANFTTIFTFLTYLENEESLTPWLTALNAFSYLRSLIRDSDLNSDMDAYMLNILSNIYLKLGIDKVNANNEEGLLRQRIVNAMCEHGNQGCIQDTVKDYIKISNDDKYTPNNDVRPVIICNGIRQQNDAKAWMNVYNSIFNHVLPLGKNIRKVYYEALACPEASSDTNNAGVTKFLDLIFMNNESIPFDDIRMAFRAIYSNPDHVTTALDYFAYNEYTFRDDVTTNVKIQLLKDITPYLTKNIQRERLMEFVNKTRPSQEMVSAVKQSLDQLTKTKTFLESNHDELKRALNSKDILPTVTPTSPTKVTPTKTPTSSTTPSSGTGTTGTGTVTPTGSAKPTTKKPNSASILTAFNLFTLFIFYLGLHFIT